MAVKDTFYISHGLATLSIDESLPARHFLKSWKDRFLTQRPKSILVVSGHWETSVPTVNIIQRNESIHDFYGSPQEIYQGKYLRWRGLVGVIDGSCLVDGDRPFNLIQA